MTCRHCGKSISILRRLSDAEFCSPEHRRMFTEMQQHLAFARLLEAQQKLSALPKAPLNPKTGELAQETRSEEPSGLAPYLSSTLSPFPAGMSVLRGVGAEWPGWRALMPALEFAIVSTWQTGAHEAAPVVEPKVERRDPAAWARLARIPYFEPRTGGDPLPQTSNPLLWEPLRPTPLQALLFALQEPTPAVAGTVDTRPNFLEICLSFLRVTGIPAPTFYHLTPEPLDIHPSVMGWPVWSAMALDLMPAAPGAVSEVVPGPEPEPEQTSHQGAAADLEGLHLDFEAAAAFPTFGIDRIAPLWGGVSKRLRTITPVSARVFLQTSPEPHDLPFAAALKHAVAAPAPFEEKFNRRGSMAGQVPVPVAPAWHSGTPRGVVLASSSHRTSLIPVSLTSLFTASFNTFLHPKTDHLAALPAPAQTVPPRTIIEAGLFTSLNAAGLVGAPSVTLHDWTSAASAVQLQGPLPSTPGCDRLPSGHSRTRTAALPLAAMLPIPVRILARRSKV